MGFVDGSCWYCSGVDCGVAVLVLDLKLEFVLTFDLTI